MSDEIRKPELRVVRKTNEGVTDITDDTIGDKLDNGKRRLGKALRNISYPDTFLKYTVNFPHLPPEKRYR